MERVRSADNKVIPFPKPDHARLEAAIEAFERGDQSPALFDEFSALSVKGMKEANYFLGSMLEDGSNGRPQDHTAALRYYENSIEGYGYVEAYIGAARLLYHGDGIRQDLKRAYQYYEHVATNHGHLVACFTVGRMLQRGEGTLKDLDAARHWYDKAIDQGSIYGMLNLAALEAEEGRLVRSLVLRFNAGLRTFLIAKANRGDARLRGG